MTRRGFLGAIAAALVAPDPEQLLWRPGAKLISIPRPAPIGWLGGGATLRVGDIITIPARDVKLAFHKNAFAMIYEPVPVPSRILSVIDGTLTILPVDELLPRREFGVRA
jgi:hypothetical protein